MIHQGPIPYVVHIVLDYLLGAFLIVAPFLLGYDSGAATAVSIVLGVGLLVVTSSTDSRISLVDAIPIPVHVLLDIGAGILAIASPFLFGFSDESAPTAIFIATGVLEFLLVIGTRFPRQERTVTA